MDHLADCVLNNTAPLTPGEEGLKDMKVITAIYEAARTGKPVSLT
jgi:predicted dehydrogenase